ncbi:MAG: hypothetical protein SGJ11_00710 [Phycisphaerae bacterium]|nr:hypothetical protein [Phycisphaerae bacterium]
MNAIVLVVIGAMSYAGAVLILCALNGRMRFDLPICARCGSDVRRFAWRRDGAQGVDRCACGADLSISGAVRGRERQRGRRLLIFGRHGRPPMHSRDACLA